VSEATIFLNFQSLKAAKVKLAKEIKKSAENFRSWKQNQEKEVGKLKAAAVRGKVQMEKITRKHNTDQNFLRRKVSRQHKINADKSKIYWIFFQFEEAVASNKRLQALIKKSINEKLPTTSRANNDDKLNKWLAHEIEAQKTKAIHTEALRHLKAERDRLKKEISSLKVHTKQLRKFNFI
jgi:uncharacterized protein YfdQ (DUF2303 family)